MKHTYKFRDNYESNARIKRRAMEERSSIDVRRDVSDEVHERLTVIEQDEDVHHSIRNLK